MLLVEVVDFSPLLVIDGWDDIGIGSAMPDVRELLIATTTANFDSY